VTAFLRRLGLPNTLLRFPDLDWDRRWLSELDPSYRDASGDRTIDFPFAKYSDTAVGEAFRHVSRTRASSSGGARRARQGGSSR
jgi:hypothetical protein